MPSVRLTQQQQQALNQIREVTRLLDGLAEQQRKAYTMLGELCQAVDPADLLASGKISQGEIDEIYAHLVLAGGSAAITAVDAAINAAPKRRRRRIYSTTPDLGGHPLDGV